MYISIKLPPAFGSFNRLRKENYPFNNLFTSYLAAVSRLGLSLGIDVGELVGYIEDRVFDGQRVPDVPEGNEPVNIRYKTDDPDVIKYIGGTALTNRMAVMYIARMTLRLSAAYGTSLFRLTKLINDIGCPSAQAKPPKKTKETDKAEQVQETETVSKPERPKKTEPEETSAPMPHIKRRLITQTEEPAENPSQTASVSASVEAAKAALNELDDLAAQAETVTTNPYLNQFM